MRSAQTAYHALALLLLGFAVERASHGAAPWTVVLAQTATATQTTAAPAAPILDGDPITFACPVRGAFTDRDKYFSQFYEDYVLSYVFRDLTTGTYVDVGASDPDAGSVTKYFYRKGWRGVNIEPNPQHQISLRKARPEDSNVEVGISDESATLQFYNFEQRATGLSTFDRDTALRHQASGFKFEVMPIPVTTLTDVLSKNDKVTGPFTFLNVDVEGFEKKVLTGLDFAKYPPTVVMLESTAPLTEDPTQQNWEAILFKAGYVFALDDGLNRYYLHPSQRALLQRFIEVNYCVARDKMAKHIKLDGFMPEPTP